MATMTGLVDGVATTMTELANGTILISTTKAQADWNERFAVAYRELQDASRALTSAANREQDTSAAVARYQRANERLDALDVEAENLLAEDDSEYI